jgi:hypothetical protein
VTEISQPEPESLRDELITIAQQIALAFGVDIDKDVVRRILGIHFRQEAGSGGPS